MNELQMVDLLDLGYKPTEIIPLRHLTEHEINMIIFNKRGYK